MGKQKDEKKSEQNGWVELKVEGMERRADTSDDEWVLTIEEQQE